MTRLLLASLLAVASPLALACSGSLHIELADAGVYGLDQAAVVAAQPGLADCANDDLVLTQRGKEVPLRIDGASDRFAAGARLEWLGEPLHGPESWFDAYSLENVYVLSAAPGKPHARIVDVAASGNGGAPLRRLLHLEEENLMIRLNQSHMKLWEEPDYWHWAKLTHVDAAPFETSFDLADLNAGGGNVTLALTFRGMSEVPRANEDMDVRDHQVDVSVNGRAAAPLAWNGRDEVVQTFTLPAAALREKGNVLQLRTPLRHHVADAANPLVDVVMFNRAEISYPADGDLDRLPSALRTASNASPTLRHAASMPVLFGSDGKRYLGRAAGKGWNYAAIAPSVTLQPLLDANPRQPLLLRAIQPGNWQKPDAGYDYLVVAHKRLIEAIQPLVDFHRERGLKVALLDVDDVYDQFNDGIAHPQAIRNLVDAAWKRWPAPKPKYLLLVGDSSFDIRHKKIERTNLAKWADRELTQGPGFGDIPSTPYSDTPDDLPHRNLIPTWQFPSYDGQSASDNHFASVDKDPLHPVLAVGRFPVVRADEVKAIVDKTIRYLRAPQYGDWRRDAMFIADETDYFKQSSDQIAASLGTQGFVADKVYASAEESDNLAHQAAIKDGLNEGRLLVHFIGHGGRYIWRTGPPDLRKNHDLFGLDDVAKLDNGDRLPMILSMTCYSAPFDNPTEDSIGEKFLREPNRGAVAVFAASWRNSPSPAYSKALIEQLLHPGTSIGEAIVSAKTKMTDPTLVETYNLLGDPAIVLERPNEQVRLRKSEGSFGRERIEATVARERFDGKVSADWVDDKGKVIASSQFAALGNRFIVPIPDRASAAQELRLYVADAGRAYDAIGRLVLVPPAPPAPPPAAPKPPVPAAAPAKTAVAPPPAPAPVPANQPPRPDKIVRYDFDESAAKTAHAAVKKTQPPVSGGVPCPSCVAGAECVTTCGGAASQSSRSALRK